MPKQLNFEFGSLYKYPQCLFWAMCIFPILAILLNILWDWQEKGMLDTTLVVPITFFSTAAGRTIYGFASLFICLSLYLLAGDTFRFMRKTARRKVKPLIYKLLRYLVPLTMWPMLFAHIMQVFYLVREPVNQLVYHAMAFGLQPTLFLIIDICLWSIDKNVSYKLYLYDLLLAADNAAYLYYGYYSFYKFDEEIPLKVIALLGYGAMIGNAIRWPLLGAQLRGRTFFNKYITEVD